MVDDNTMGDVTEGGTGTGVAAPDDCCSAEAPGVTPERKALVKRWLGWIKESEKHHQPAFDRIDKAMLIAAHGVEKKSDIPSDTYIVPIINRHINQVVASLYARDPTMAAKRKQKLMYVLWDGDPASVQAAMQRAQMAMSQPAVDPMTGMPMADPMTGQMMPGQPDPNDLALLQEIEEARQQIIQLDRMAKTLNLLFAYYMGEQAANYKKQFKAAVRRAKVCGISYVKLGFQRVLQKNPDVEAEISDITSKIVAIETALKEAAAGEMKDGTAAVEELRLNVQDLQSRAEIVVREGPVLSFPRAKEIIVDKRCRDLPTFSGARWIAHKFDMTPEDIEEVYKHDVKSCSTEYRDDSKPIWSEQVKASSTRRVYEVQDKKNNQVFTVCDGYPDFLNEPAEPDVKLERFWTVFPIVFNEIESEDEIYPPSDAWNARHMQREYNSTRQGLREHRVAARPRFATAKGQLEKDDKAKLGSGEPFEVIELNSMTPDTDISKILQRLPVPGLDPNLYETVTIFTDIQHVVGSQEANFGGTSGSTATESSIAENSRMAASSADTDGLDDVLTDLAKAMGQLMLLELAKETVVEICGPGAVWPETSIGREQVVKDLMLEIEAGSSGRPNKAAELANFERAAPWLVQMPGLDPRVIAKRPLAMIDIDIEEAFVEGLPSIVAMNQMAGRNQQAGGDPAADPNQQGGQGAQNAPNPQANEPQGQPAHPAPMGS